ncbi:hypothetical protein [Psychrobacter sp. TAE2020]|uniref:hypothetical protein n=1 Tax=Psychrobacter sp. TAE2020 TaxID=2846762 RepID=UPI001E426A7B|nr:hypothetical protein [Psychrobacter sp. TAE2020]
MVISAKPTVTKSGGTESKAPSTAGNAVSTDVLAILKQSQQSKAAQGKEVKATNPTLSGYRQKL